MLNQWLPVDKLFFLCNEYAENRHEEEGSLDRSSNTMLLLSVGQSSEITKVNAFLISDHHGYVVYSFVRTTAEYWQNILS